MGALAGCGGGPPQSPQPRSTYPRSHAPSPNHRVAHSRCAPRTRDAARAPPQPATPHGALRSTPADARLPDLFSLLQCAFRRQDRQPRALGSSWRTRRQPRVHPRFAQIEHILYQQHFCSSHRNSCFRLRGIRSSRRQSDPLALLIRRACQRSSRCPGNVPILAHPSSCANPGQRTRARSIAPALFLLLVADRRVETSHQTSFPGKADALGFVPDPCYTRGVATADHCSLIRSSRFKVQLLDPPEAALSNSRNARRHRADPMHETPGHTVILLVLLALAMSSLACSTGSLFERQPSPLPPTRTPALPSRLWTPLLNL